MARSIKDNGSGLLDSAQEETNKAQLSEEENLKQALTHLAQFAAKQPRYQQPSCVFVSKSLGQDEKKILFDELNAAGILIRTSAENNNTQKLDIEKTNFGIEAKLQKPGKVAKSFILSGGLRVEGTWSLVREMYDIDQRKAEINRIARQLRAHKYKL